MTDDDDDNDDAPSWMKLAWELQLALEKHTYAGCALRISTVKPNRRPVIDRWLWVRGMAPASDTFNLGHPTFNVPEGWRFAFPIGKTFGWSEIHHLRHMPIAHLLKIQVLKVGEHVGNKKQIAFNPSQAEVVAEFSLE